MIKISNLCADQPLSNDQIFLLIQLGRIKTYASTYIWSKHDQFHIQICMGRNLIKNFYIMRWEQLEIYQIVSIEMKIEWEFFHLNKMISKSIFISFEWNESALIQLSFQLERKFLALLPTRFNSFRGVIVHMLIVHENNNIIETFFRQIKR